MRCGRPGNGSGVRVCQFVTYIKNGTPVLLINLLDITYYFTGGFAKPLSVAIQIKIRGSTKFLITKPRISLSKDIHSHFIYSYTEDTLAP